MHKQEFNHPPSLTAIYNERYTDSIHEAFNSLLITILQG